MIKDVITLYMPADGTTWTFELAAAGIGGLIGGTLGAYYKSYWMEKGKNLATYKDIEFLLAQERGKAYEQETGKRLATHEDIENVLKEVQAVTEKTETIKAQIGNDLWTKQMIWQQKRLSYAAIVREALVFLVSLESIQRCLEDETQNYADAVVEHKNAFSKLNAAFFEAEILMSKEASQLMEDFRIKCREAVYLGKGPDVAEFSNFVGSWSFYVSEAAKRDLGITSNE